MRGCFSRIGVDRRLCKETAGGIRGGRGPPKIEVSKKEVMLGVKDFKECSEVAQVNESNVH